MYIISHITHWLRANRTMAMFSLLHALWLLVFTFIWLSQSMTYGDEMFLIQMTSGVRQSDP